MEWSKTHVYSTFHICWGAQAGLYYHYGIKKHLLDEKLFGVYPHHVDKKNTMLFRGFDDIFYVPQSRHTTFLKEDVLKVPGLEILASSEEAGIFALYKNHGRQIFITGHAEYDADTLYKEYKRDLELGKEIHKPYNYFPNDVVTDSLPVTWRSSANLMFSNWLNYFVYQNTPYDITKIQIMDHEKKRTIPVQANLSGK